MVKIDSIELDATVTEKHTGMVEVTKHPIEQGANPTDHARVLPWKLQIEGLLTNTPLGAETRLARGINNSASSTGAPGAAGQAQRSFAALEKLRTDRKTVTVLTSTRRYTNMLITQIEQPVEAKIGDAIRFTMSLEEVRFVRSEVARIEITNRPARKPTKKVDQTKKPGTEKAEMRQSLLKKFTDFTGFTTPGSGLQ